MNQLNKYPINQPVNPSINPSTKNKLFNQAGNQSILQSINQFINQSINQSCSGYFMSQPYVFAIMGIGDVAWFFSQLVSPWGNHRHPLVQVFDSEKNTVGSWPTFAREIAPETLHEKYPRFWPAKLHGFPGQWSGFSRNVFGGVFL